MIAFALSILAVIAGLSIVLCCVAIALVRGAKWADKEGEE